MSGVENWREAVWNALAELEQADDEISTLFTRTLMPSSLAYEASPALTKLTSARRRLTVALKEIR